MSLRRSLKLPIILGVVLILLVVLLAIGWVLLTSVGVYRGTARLFYLLLLAIGVLGFLAILVGVSIYLGLTVKTINLTRRQSNFIDSVTHELKSPIASIKLYLQTLNQRDVDDSVRRKFYRSMLDDVQRLDQLIDHVLDVARLDNSRHRGEWQEVDLGRVIANCADMACHRYHVSRDCIELELAPGLARAELLELEIVFRNLLDNAVKYAGDPPEVRVSLDFPTPQQARVRIADNGPGIPEKQRKRIFERFERLGIELERSKPGLGLGLHLVRTLVGRMQGRVRAMGRTDGPGTLFEVRLPGRALAEGQQPSASPGGPSPDAGAKSSSPDAGGKSSSPVQPPTPPIEQTTT